MTADITRDVANLKRGVTTTRIEEVEKKFALLNGPLLHLFRIAKVITQQEEDVMKDFNTVRTAIEKDRSVQTDEDAFKELQERLMLLAGKRANIQKEQGMLAKQVCELQVQIQSLVDVSDVQDPKINVSTRFLKN